METKILLQERRSVGTFDKSKTIDKNLLKDIIDLAVYAPSGFNLQPWRLIAVESEDAKQKLFALANNQDKVLEAPVTLIVIGDKDGYSDNNPVWKEFHDTVGGNMDIVNGAKGAAAYLYGSTEERKTKFVESNCGLLAMSIMVAAKEYGVDSHPMSGIDFDGIHKAFGLKESESVVMCITLGYYKNEKPLHARRPRRGFEDILTIE